MEMAEFLLKEGANVNVTDQDQRSTVNLCYFVLSCVMLRCVLIPCLALHSLTLLLAPFCSLLLAAASSPPDRR